MSDVVEYPLEVAQATGRELKSLRAREAELAAEVERNHGDLLTQAKRAGLPVEQLKRAELAEHLADRVLELEALLSAARVAVEKLWTECRHDCACCNLPGRDCDCGAEITIELRRAVGLEGSHG